MRDTRFHARMKPQPTTLEARVMTWPTASGARMLVTWSIRLMVAFIPFVEIKDTEIKVGSLVKFKLQERPLMFFLVQASVMLNDWRKLATVKPNSKFLTSQVTSVVACNNDNPVPLNGNGQRCACKVCHICQDDHHRITNHLVWVLRCNMLLRQHRVAINSDAENSRTKDRGKNSSNFSLQLCILINK